MSYLSKSLTNYACGCSSSIRLVVVARAGEEYGGTWYLNGSTRAFLQSSGRVTFTHCCPHCSHNAGHESDNDALAIRMVALLKEETVAAQMKTLFYLKELVAVISSLTAKVDYLTTQLNIRDDRIDRLEKWLSKLEIDSDNQEQYTRRPNVRIKEISEQGDGITDDNVLFVINDTMCLMPPIALAHIQGSHRLGPKTDREGRPRTRAVIVRFRTERIRDTVCWARTVLKHHNKQHSDAQLYLNEDLTARRASLAFETRKLKQLKKI